MVFSPQGQSGRDVRLTTRLTVTAGVTTLPIYLHGKHRNKFTSYPHLSSFLQGVFKKRPNFCHKDFILQPFKRCPLQSSPLYWRYTIPNVSAVVGMLPGTHFL
jgi:hypothetical protein